MEIRINVDDAFLRNLQDKIGNSPQATDIVRDALTILNWAIGEVADGRVLLSSSACGDDVHRLVMPTLCRVETRARLQDAAQHLRA
jgi:hypothetical protein